MKTIELILEELKRNNFVNLSIDMNNTSSKYIVKATHWIRKNAVPDIGNDLNMGSSRFVQYECAIGAIGDTIEECADKLISYVTHESKTGDVYKFPEGFYK